MELYPAFICLSIPFILPKRRKRFLSRTSLSFERISTACLKVDPLGISISMLLLPNGRGLRKSAAMYIANIAKMQTNKMLTSLFIFLACQNQQLIVNCRLLQIVKVYAPCCKNPLL